MKDIMRDTYIKLVKDAIANNFSLCIIVSGRSMLPTIETGEKILIRSVRSEQIKIGDIVVYETNNKIISHRIVSSGPLRFMIKGDHELVWRTYNHDCILGKVISIEKHDGCIINLETRTWRIINCIFAIYSLSTGLIYQKLCIIKKNLLKNKNNYFLNFTSKIFCASIFIPPKSLIYFLSVHKMLKSKLKSNTA